MTNEEIEKFTEKVYPKIKNIPGLDKSFIRKCLEGVSALGDKETEEKLKNLFKLYVN